MRALPLGVPKILVCTAAPEQVRIDTGTSDILLMHSLTPADEAHAFNEQMLGNASHALAGMIEHPARQIKTITF
jgi:uncharacterized protein (UPF0261 family)